MTNLKPAIGTSNSNLMNMKTDVNTTMNQAKNTNDSVNVLQSQITLNKNNNAVNANHKECLCYKDSSFQLCS